MFPTTRQSAVLGVRSEDAAERTRALDRLVEAYWKPVYKYVRLKWNEPPENAQDLAQSFFARALEKDFFRGYDPERGSFRTWLRTCIDGFTANERKSRSRLKRGGGARILPLDFESAEGELRTHAPPAAESLEKYFHDEFVRSLFALAVEDLHILALEQGKEVHFALFERYDLDAADVSYADLGREFGLPVTSVTNYLAWARREFRRLVLQRLRDITASEREFRAEARALLGIRPK